MEPVGPHFESVSSKVHLLFRHVLGFSRKSSCEVETRTHSEVRFGGGPQRLDTCRGKATPSGIGAYSAKSCGREDYSLNLCTHDLEKTASRLAMLIDCYPGASSYEVGHRNADFIPVVADRNKFLAKADLGAVLIDEDLDPSIAVDGFRETRAFLRSVPIRNPSWTPPLRPTCGCE